jgi:hypothetical protein
MESEISRCVSRSVPSRISTSPFDLCRAATATFAATNDNKRTNQNLGLNMFDPHILAEAQGRPAAQPS